MNKWAFFFNFPFVLFNVVRGLITTPVLPCELLQGKLCVYVDRDLLRGHARSQVLFTTVYVS